MALKVIVCGEGSLDVGYHEYGSDRWINGPAIIYIQKASPVALEISCIDHQELIKTIRFNKFRSDPSKAHGIKAERLSRYAKINTYSVAICYVDCDKRVFIDIFAEVQDGFVKSQSNVTGIAMIPKKMIESWLLADESAFGAYFKRIPISPVLPSHPEEIWGDKHDPQSNYPKNLIDRVLSQFPAIDNKIEFYNEIADKSRPDELRRKCPVSYGQFYQDMQRIKNN